MLRSSCLRRFWRASEEGTPGALTAIQHKTLHPVSNPRVRKAEWKGEKMTAQQILMRAVVIAGLGTMCMAQNSTGYGSSPAMNSPQQQSGYQQQQRGATQHEPSEVNTPSSTNTPSGMSGRTTKHRGRTSAGTMGKSPDQLFISKAARGGLAEVALGKLAQQKAKSEDVREFGSKMATDHAQANDELKQLAEQKGIKVAATLAAKDKQAKSALSTKRGANFDKAYMRDMVKDHETDVSEFRKEAENGQDPE